MLTSEQIYDLLKQVKDPEIPVLSVVNLGIIKAVRVSGEQVEVDMVPTFAGCPAIEVMRADILNTCRNAGLAEVKVNVLTKQEWSSNQITDEGIQQLRDFGIAPPPKIEGEVELADLHKAQCPVCNSWDTKLLSGFGPTACRAIHHCNECRETFEQMKPL